MTMTNPTSSSRVSTMIQQRKGQRQRSSSQILLKKSIFLLMMLVPTFVLIINSMRFNINEDNSMIIYEDEDNNVNRNNFDSPSSSSVVVSKDNNNIRKLQSSSSLSSSSSSSSSSLLMSPTTTTTTTTDSTTTANKSPNNNKSNNNNNNNNNNNSNNKVKVFIGIKTAATKYKTTSDPNKQHHGSQRLPQITSTWLHDVVTHKDQIDLKFFASSEDLHVFSEGQKQKQKQKWNSTNNTNDDSPPNIIDFNSEESINDWFIKTPQGCNQHCCKGEMMFKYYLNKYAVTNNVAASASQQKNSDEDDSQQSNNNNNNNNNDNDYSTWFCSFDDDNYILIDNLLKVLNDFERNATSPSKVYVGRTSLNAVFRQQYMSSKNIRYINFLTGGAGYCMSKKLMLYGSQIYKEYGHKQKVVKLNGFYNFTKYCLINHLPDDVSVGLWINHDLNIEQTIHKLFHSHLETNIRNTLPINEITKQVSFGYDNKKKNKNNGSDGGTSTSTSNNTNTNNNNNVKVVVVPDYFPNIPIGKDYNEEDDPMLFKSLRKFILDNKDNDQE